MNQAIRDKIDGLANIRNMMELKFAAKAMYRDLAFGNEEFDLQDVRTFIVNLVGEAMTEAAEEGPVGLEDFPTLPDAIAYVKRYVREGADRSAMENYAEALWDLPVEAMQLLMAELDKEEIE